MALASIIKQFQYYQHLGNKTIDQLADEQLFWQANESSNSMASIVKHLWGNMLSRWTDFLTADGEKPWREREAEFDNDIRSRAELLHKWEEGWACLFDAITPLKEEDLDRIIYIRNQGHTIIEALHRQLGHYASHVGQMVFLGKMIKGDEWKSLSIPRGGTAAFNAKKFAEEKHRAHFADEMLGEDGEE